MTMMVLKTTLLTVDALSLQTWCNKAELTVEVEEKEVTTFASLGWKEVLGGNGSFGLALSFRNSFGAAELDALMWARLGLVLPWTLKAADAAVSATNPLYGGSLLLKNWTPIAGAPGDVNEASYTWPGSAVPTRVTA